MKTRSGLVLVFLSLYIMAGCAGVKNQFEEKKFYKIQSLSGMADSNTPETGEGLMVKRFAISPEFETNSFVYRLTPTRFAMDYYNSFIVSPARMITDVIQEDLWASPLFSPVPAHAMDDVRFQLWGKVTDFYGDIQNLKQPRAIVTIRLILEKKMGEGFTQILNKTYGAQVKLDSPDPSLLAEGFGKGINEILNAFYNDLASDGLAHDNQ